MKRFLPTLLLVPSLAYAHPGSPLLADAESPPPNLAARPAASETKVQSVFILVLSGGEVAAPDALDDAARQEIESNTALALAPRDSFSNDLRTQTVSKCAGDPKCFANALRTAGVDVDLILTISATNVGEGTLLGLRLIDADKGQGGQNVKDIATFGEELPSGSSPVRATKEFTKNVFPPTIWGQIASVVVEVDQPSAEVLVGASQCVSPCKLDRMLPGRYPVVVKKSGFVNWTGDVSLAAKGTETLKVSMIEEETPLTSSPWFWGAIGLGVAAVGTAAIVLATANDGPVVVCIARDITQCE
ncbi:MAG: PEGA domain-containing protein [Deltaproteobacteria bacterium]|nr:PEGA domain-containing protein [Deltaproteobacteria bacterium]